MKSGIKSLLGSVAVAAVAVPMMMSAASACTITSFTSNGCFSNPAPVGTPFGVTYPTPNTADVQGDAGHGGGTTQLSLIQSTGVFNYVSFIVSALNATPFTLSVSSYAPSTDWVEKSGPSVITQAMGPVPVTFFSSVGLPVNGTLVFNANPTIANTATFLQISDVTLSAPAPIPGAGFFSFIAMGFAASVRRGRTLLTRLRGGKLATA